MASILVYAIYLFTEIITAAMIISGKNLRRTYQVYGALCGALPQVAEQI